MAFDKLKWFQGKKQQSEEAQQVVLDELQGLKKLLRKQSVLMEEVRREQEALATRKRPSHEPLLELCDAVFYLQRAFQNPGLMSRQHAQVLNMVRMKMDRFASSVGLEMILEEGIRFDPKAHEAVANRSPGAPSLEVLEVVQPGYLLDGKILRPAKVIVGAPSEPIICHEGSSLQ
ncbi:MAG: nucleotide exchange factor GrpE [Syntrophobacteraceae bacterium]